MSVHSTVGGSAWEPTPWRAVQRAGWAAVNVTRSLMSQMFDGLPLWYFVAAFHRASGRRSRRRTLWHLARPQPSFRAPKSVCAEVSQMPDDGDNPGLDRFHVHIRCFVACEFERGANR